MSFSVPKMEAKYSAIFQRTPPTRQPKPPTLPTSSEDVTGRDDSLHARRSGSVQLEEALPAWGRDEGPTETPSPALAPAHSLPPGRVPRAACYLGCELLLRACSAPRFPAPAAGTAPSSFADSLTPGRRSGAALDKGPYAASWTDLNL